MHTFTTNSANRRIVIVARKDYKSPNERRDYGLNNKLPFEYVMANITDYFAWPARTRLEVEADLLSRGHTSDYFNLICSHQCRVQSMALRSYPRYVGISLCHMS